METQHRQHPPALHMAALALGKLKSDVAATVQSHLDECDDCRRFVADTSREEMANIIGQARGKSTAEQNTQSTGLSGTIVGLPTPPLPPTLNTAALLAPPNSSPQSTPSPVTHAVSESEIPHDLFAQSKYRIVRVLGRGGMGTVYEAEHVRMQRPVAIKVVNPELVNHPQALLRFEEEIKAVASLDHANIARAFDAENIGSLQVFVMEFVRGQTLYEFFKSRGRLSVVDAYRCVRQALIGLQHAHQQGLVHRDLKPQNLMLTRDTGQIKILDFGLAKAVSENRQSRGLTSTRATMGTFAYMAPEQALDAAKADIRADIYSLGCTLYLLLSGVLPFDYESDTKLLLAHQSEIPLPLHEAYADVPKELSDLVARMLAKNPEDRPQTPREAADALLPFARGESGKTGAMPVLTTSPAAGRGINGWMRGVIAAAILALFGFGGWAAGLFSIRTPQGAIIIDGVPDNADVFVDNQTVNVTRNGDSLTISAIAQGPHHLKLVQAAREIWSDDVTVAMAGQLLKVRFESNELSASVRSSKLPPAAGSVQTATAPNSSSKGIPHTTLKVDGQWNIDHDELVVVSSGRQSAVSFGNVNWTDYDLNFKVCRVDGDAATGCNFRQDMAGNWGHFGMGWSRPNMMGTDLGFKTVGKGGLGHFGPILPIELGQWYDIEITCRGSEFRTSVDGKQFYHPTRDEFKRGAVGLWASGNGTVHFKDIKVTAPDGTTLWEGLPDLSAPAQSSGELGVLPESPDADPSIGAETDPASPAPVPSVAANNAKSVDAAPIDRYVQTGSVWSGQKTYDKNHYNGVTVSYFLNITERNGATFKGLKFDNGRHRNRSDVDGEINGGVLTWRELGYKGNMRGILSADGKTIQATAPGFFGGFLVLTKDGATKNSDRPSPPVANHVNEPGAVRQSTGAEQGASQEVSPPANSDSAKEVAGKPIELLAQVQLPDDASGGDWIKTSDGIESGNGTLKLAYVPHGEYDFQVSFTCKAEKDPNFSDQLRSIAQILSFDGNDFGWVMGKDGCYFAFQPRAV